MAEEILISESVSKDEKYQSLLPQLQALVEGESDLIANLANVSAVLKDVFQFWWVGFYLLKNDELVLGPFQGPLACSRIAIGKGVCGKAAQSQKSILVPNVNQFEGHIACSADSQSEIVVPIVLDGNLLAVLDVDSELLNHFDEIDQENLEKLAAMLANLDWSKHV